MPYHVLLHNNPSEEGPTRATIDKRNGGLGWNLIFLIFHSLFHILFFVLRLVLVAGKGAGFTVEIESVY